MSGYVVSTTQLLPSHYRVAIDMALFSVLEDSSGGRISPNAADSFSTANLPTTLAKGINRARSNIRFNQIAMALSNISDCQLLDITITEANSDVQSNSLAFTVRYERPQGILGNVKNMLGSPYTGADSLTEITTDLLALKDQITRAICQTRTQNFKVVNGANKEDYTMSVSVSAPLPIATVWEKVTVTLISETEVI